VRRYLVEKYIRPQNCSFSDIFGPDLTPRVVALCMGIAICHRRKFEQVGYDQVRAVDSCVLSSFISLICFDFIDRYCFLGVT